MEPVILIVDDNPKNLQVLGRILQMENYKVEFAINGEVALEWINSKPFDLVLLDVNMPEMNGYEVCRKIRSASQWNSLPIIFLSAESDRESILKGFEIGAQDYVTKPFDSRELIARVKTHLALKNSLEKLEGLNQHLEEKVVERTQQLTVALEKAEASSRLKTAFIHSISHEVRTPLNGILGFAQLILQPGIDEAMKNNFLEMLYASNERLLNTITSYVDISLIVSDNQQVNLKPVSLSQLFDQIYAQFQPRCSAKNLKLAIELPESDVDTLVKSDPELLKKILQHLLDNAVKFTEEGNISFGYQLNSKEFLLFVHDTGVGINPKVMNDLYTIFFQEELSDTGKYEGSGLGLSVVKGFVDLLGGKIRLESEKNRGTSCFVTFPIEQGVNKTEGQPGVPRRSGATSTKSVMVVEDDFHNSMFFETVLLEASFQVVKAHNGQVAVDLFSTLPDISLILMDIKMPVMNGFEALKQIRSLRNDVPIVAISAYAMSGDEQRILDGGFDGYISKPIKRDQLLQTVNKFISAQ